MSQQGDRRRHEDDWWGELYDPRRADAGPAAASDSVDDRFDSASRTLAGAGDAGAQRPAAGAPWGPRTGEPGDAAPGPDADPGGGPQGWRSPADEGPGAASPFRGGAGPGPARGGDAGSGATPPSQGGAGSGAATQGGNAGSGGAGRTGSGAAWGGAGSGSARGDEGPGAALPSQGRAEAGASQGDAGSGDGPGRAGPGKAPGRSGPGGAADRTGSGDAPGRSGPGSAPGRAGASVPPPSPPPRDARPPAPPRPTTPHADPSRPWRASAASYVGDEPPTYEAEPTTLPVVDPEELRDLVPDTVLEGARYGTLTLRAASLRGGSARYRGEPRRDALLAVRFGIGDSALVLVAVASGQPAAPGAHRVARELCEWIAAAVGRNQARLTEDIHTANRGALSSGLHRLTDRAYGRLRAGATVRGLAPADHTASVRCLLLPAHPACRTRVFFGVGDGGLFRLRDGVWQDLEPAGGERDTVGGPVLGYGGGRPPARHPSRPPQPPQPPYAQADPSSAAPGSDPAPAHGPFRFRASVARPGDTLLLCSAGLAEPLRGEAALADRLAERWDTAEAPGLAAFLADAQTGVKGYADDRTAAAVWEA
ncbi:Protein phosphatase 2C [Streptomyces melanosporofaciens]|uniref:Protein phosphatase 2C n=1 Tax=Streptomyces melanosporofaciens TaxID=67327 RepID=A0A1H4V9Z7_STRMJ|nr:protein phosphatase 2C domain-containing protein [Streptomyces melanosporofaciens]SEC77438.1 Protein phosphatase 2C [Streptomyces melanosporofaciens]